MAKSIIYDANAKQKILAGIEKLEKAVASTLGPSGKNVIIDEYGAIHSTRDGVTVAKSISLKDKFENLGANAIKEVAEKSNKCGDGTTTSTVLAASIYKNGLKHVSLGANATQIKRGIKKAADHVVDYVKSISKPISERDDIKRVAVVSSNHDEEIGEIIADVMSKIGNDGTVKVENGNTTEMHSKIVEGMVIDQSYVSPYMVTNAETMEAELENPYILIVNKKLANIQELLPCLQSVTQTGASLLIIAESLQEDILATLVMNRMRSGFNCVAVNAPSFGDNRKAILDDIAILTGGRVVTDETATKLTDAVVDSGILGRASKIVVNKENTVIIGGKGSSEAIEDRAKNLRSTIENTTSDYDKEKLQERLAKLTSGIGIISVGAQTETERKELRDRVDDAFCASKAALKSGIVPGGGIALLKAKTDLESWIKTNVFVNDEAIGAKILLDSLDAPIRKILMNAGESADLIVSKIVDTHSVDESAVNIGYDVLNKKYVNMIEAGIIDPTDVVVNEVQNSASIAGLLLITDVLVVDEPEDKKCSCNEAPGMMPGMM